jgi:hypothetical protein
MLIPFDDQGTVQAIMAACSAGLILLAVSFGPERHSVRFEGPSILKVLDVGEAHSASSYLEENEAIEGAPSEAKREAIQAHRHVVTLNDEKENTTHLESA